MAKVRHKDTSPELTVRRLLHCLGYRYRLHDSRLPGKPDLVFAGRRKVIFVHGCFWHGHGCKRGARIPETNTPYWLAKVERNRVRDAHAAEALAIAGWKLHVVWECELGDERVLTRRLSRFLDG